MSVEGHRHDQYAERAEVASKAPLVSPALTGTPTAPTAAADTNTTQIATTAYVIGQAASATPLVDGTAAVGSSTRFARGDHVHPTDTSRAADSNTVHKTGTESVGGAKTFTTSPLAVSPGAEAAVVINGTSAGSQRLSYRMSNLASWDIGAIGGGSNPAFQVLRYNPSTGAYVDTPLQISNVNGDISLTGKALTSTPAVDTNTTQVATTAFVIGQASSTSPVMDGTATIGTSTRFARADHVHPTDTSRAPVASPSFTGNATVAGTVSASGLAGSLLSSATPLADAATAAVGTSAIPARQDHVHPLNTQFSRCTSNTTQATSGTYVAATGMSAAALVAGGVYKFEIVGTYSCSATTVGIAHRLSYPALNYGGASSFHFTNTTAVSSVNNPGTLGASPTTITGANVGVAGTALLFRIEGMLAPSADGNFSYSFSPASTGSATVAGNTWFLVTRVA